jgi:hypothetical protein
MRKRRDRRPRRRAGDAARPARDVSPQADVPKTSEMLGQQRRPPARQFPGIVKILGSARPVIAEAKSG